MIMKMENYHNITNNAGQLYFFIILILFISFLIYEIFFKDLKNEKDISYHNLLITILFSILFVYYINDKNLTIPLKIIIFMLCNVLLYFFLFFAKLIRFISKKEDKK